MIPPIARNTIIFTTAVAINGIVDFFRMLNLYKKKKPK